MNQDEQNISRAYREASNEQSPEHLDRAILQMARKDLGKASKSRNWQPFAFAATAVLSFGFLMFAGVTPDSPELPVDVFEDSVPATKSRSDSTEERGTDSTAMEELRIQETERLRSGQHGDAAPAANTAPVTLSSPKEADESLRRATEAVRQSRHEEEASGALAIESSQDFTAASDLAFAPERIAPPLERFCSDNQIASSGSWYACVLDLREQGKTEEADFEQSLLLTAYPDFEIR